MPIGQLAMLKARGSNVLDATYHMLYRYIPVLMAQAKIYWDLEMYQQVSMVYVCAGMMGLLNLRA